MPNTSPEWIISDQPVPYPQAMAEMEAHVGAIINDGAKERIWMLEHPPLYTGGTSAKSDDLLTPDRFPVYPTRRGGQYTYHGPGQRVVYLMLDLSSRGKDVRRYVAQLERWIISTLASFGIVGHIREGRVGVWVERPEKPPFADGSMHEDKVAAVGVRVRRWVAYHGISINVEPDLSHFDGIVPCGISGHGVTSLVDLGLPVTMDDLDMALRTEFDAYLGL